MKRFELALLIGIVVAILLSAFTAFASSCDAVRSQVVRLHVLANSDTEEDQELKLAVRDAVLRETADLFVESTGKEQVEHMVMDNLEQIRLIAQREIAAQGHNYDVQVRVVNMYFETRTYDDVTMPAGYYDAVRVEIGAGQGNNWWCVMYPPMCIPAASGEDGAALEEQIAQLGEWPQYEPRFAVVELWENLCAGISGRQEQLVSLQG